MLVPRLNPWVKFCAVFLVLFLAGTAVHYLTRPYIAPFVNRTLNAEVAARVINHITPAAAVKVIGHSVGGGNAYVRVAMGCEGIDVVLLLVVAVMAYPMSTRRKAFGALLGTLLIYGTNVLRIVGLWYCIRYVPSVFDTMHILVGQTVLIVIGGLFFAALTGAFGGTRAQRV